MSAHADGSASSAISQNGDSPWPVHSLPRSTWFLLLAALGAASVAFRAGLDKMLEAWLGSEEYSHAVLIPFICAFLIWQRKDLIRRFRIPGSWSGFLVVALGGGLLVLGRLATLLIAQQYALLIVVYGLVLALAGWRVVKLLLMPLLLLLFMIPLPQFLMQHLSAQLQLISSQIGVALIRLLGISVFLEGNVIDLGSYKLEVAEACSGLRYLFPLMTIGLILAYFFRAATWKRMLIFASSIPVTIVMNSLRIGMIGVLVEFWGPSMARGVLHDFEGWVVFMASVGVLLVEVRLLARLGGDRRPWREVLGLTFPDPTPPGASRIRNPIPTPFVASAILLVAFTAAMSLAPERVEAAPDRTRFASFPERIGDWQGRPQSLEQVYLDALKLDDYILEDYVRPGSEPVNFYVAWYNSQAAGESVHSPSSCLPGGGWRITEFGQRQLGVQIGAQPLRVNRAVIEYGTQRQLVYYWFQQRGRVITDEYQVKWLLVVDAIERHRSDGALVRLVVPLRPDQKAEDADSELVDFVTAVAPQLGAYVPG